MIHLRNCWALFDTEGTSLIKISDLIPFLKLLKEPLGFN